jgi:hypothetical protein
MHISLDNFSPPHRVCLALREECLIASEKNIPILLRIGLLTSVKILFSGSSRRDLNKKE